MMESPSTYTLLPASIIIPNQDLLRCDSDLVSKCLIPIKFYPLTNNTLITTDNTITLKYAIALNGLPFCTS